MQNLNCYCPLRLIFSHVYFMILSFFSSVVILYLRFGAKALQNNFDAELSTHYQNYILFNQIKFYPGFYCRVGLYVVFVKYVNMYSLTFDLPAEFLSFYGLLNFYLYTLAFVYSPSKNALYGRTQHQTKCMEMFVFSSKYSFILQTPSSKIILLSPC